MRIDRGIYHKRVCDRCGETVGGRCYDPDEVFSGWEWRLETGDLCPDCYAEYKKMIARFNAGKQVKREHSYCKNHRSKIGMDADICFYKGDEQE